MLVRALVKLAVISDTHMPRGTRRLPAKCLRLLAESDRILHAGDFVSKAVYDELRELAPVDAVVGNMDEPELRSILPPKLVVEHEGVRIGLLHDAGPRLGRAERLVAAFPGCHAIVYGHTHVPEATQLRDVWILNPGSPTERRSAPRHGMITLAVASGRLDVRTHVL
jgi:putative phosphoesterase